MMTETKETTMSPLDCIIIGLTLWGLYQWFWNTSEE